MTAPKRKKKSKNYFTQDTENAIVRYNGLDPIEDEELRSKIYEREIHYAFFKLTQNIILIKWIINKWNLFWIKSPNKMKLKKKLGFSQLIRILLIEY